MFEDLELKIEEAATVNSEDANKQTTDVHTCTTNTCSMGKLCC